MQKEKAEGGDDMQTIKQKVYKLQLAINQNFGKKLTYNKTQFYSEDQDRPVTIHTIKQCIHDEGKKRNKYIELFSSCSQLQILLFLRDLWYELNGWEVPTDNEEWNKAKESYYDSKTKKAEENDG